MKRKNTGQSRLPRAKGTDMGTVLMPEECAKKVKRMVLHPETSRILEEFVAILDMKEKFEAYEVPVPNKIVMFGPPGTGKTLTAYYLAERLGLPLILVRLDAVIHSHLGETASNVRRIFDFAKSSPCILFLDEFDAVARTRENSEEIKEMARVVNTLLQCLDEFEGDSIFMAATNLEEELDHAVWRRFDTRMTYRMPDDACRREFVRLLLQGMELEERAEEHTVLLVEGCSFADIEQIVVKAKRKAILQGGRLTCAHIQAACAEYNPKRVGIPSGSTG